MRKKTALPAEKLWDYALKALGARAHSTGELRRKLRDRAEKLADVEDTIGRLREYGYLNDRRFAEGYAGARLENQGLGKSRVLRDLRARQLSPAVAEKAVERVYGGVDETKLIASFLQRKVHTKAPLAEALEDRKILASVYRKLVYAGFSPGNVITTLKKIAKGQDLPDDLEAPLDIEEE